MSPMFGSDSLLERAHALIWAPVIDEMPVWRRALYLSARIG